MGLSRLSSIGRTYRAIVTVMVEDGEGWKKLIKSVGFHGSIVAGKDELVKGLVKSKMLTRRGH